MGEEKNGTSPAVDESKLQDMIAESDTGARSPTGIPAKVLWFVPLAWALFQLWFASPMPYIVRVAVLNSTEVRSIHLAFAIFLAYLAYPAFQELTA